MWIISIIELRNKLSLGDRVVVRGYSGQVEVNIFTELEQDSAGMNRYRIEGWLTTLPATVE